MLARILFGLAGMVAGFFMVWRPLWFLEMLGEQEWMNKIFGEGKAVSGYKLLGVVIILVSILVATGLIQGILLWFFSPIIRSGIQ